MITGAREDQLMQAANLLMDARRTRQPIGDLPEDLRPVSVEEAYFVEDALVEAYGEVGGWKVGAPNLETTPTFAPLPAAWIAAGGCELAASGHRYRGLECEIAFQLGEDLPAREAAYSREEALAAVGSCHPVIEVLESGLLDPVAATKLSMIADLQMHGGLVYGPAFADWRTNDWTTEKVALAIDGTIRVERTGSNTSGDLVGLLPWLANQGKRTGGLRKGQWITTGSWTGNEQAISGSAVDADFSRAGRVSLRFG